MLSFYKGIENDIIAHLAEGSLPTKALVKTIAGERSVTDQGVYKALKYLIDNEVVTKEKRTVGLSYAWLERLVAFTDDVAREYEMSDMNDFLRLNDKEKASYTFTEYFKSDTHWAHIFFLLAKRIDAPIFLLSAHNWFVIARPDTESVIYEWANRAQRHMYTLTKSNTALDKAAQKTIESDFVHFYHDEDMSAPLNHFVTVIGDFIFDFIIPEHVADTIEKYYAMYTELNEESIGAFRTLSDTKWPVKFTVEKNVAKARKLRRRIAKDFFISADVKKKWLT